MISMKNGQYFKEIISNNKEKTSSKYYCDSTNRISLNKKDNL